MVSRVEDIIRETKNKVKMGEVLGESFWTGRGVRQGCPLSPYLFNLLTAEDGGVKLGTRKYYTLSYADDMVILE